MTSKLVRSARKPAAGASSIARGAGRRTRQRAQRVRGRHGPQHRADWRSRYARRLWLSDLRGAHLRRLRHADRVVRARQRPGVDPRGLPTERRLVLVLLRRCWSSRGCGRSASIDSRSDRAIGTGSTEYVRVISVSIRLFGIIAILRVPAARRRRPRLSADQPAPRRCWSLLLERWLWRQWLVRQRARGEFSARVLLVGSESSVAQIGAGAAPHPERRLPRGRRVRRRRHRAGGTVRGHRHPDRRVGARRSRTRSRASRRGHRRDHEHRRAAAVGREAHLVGARGRQPAPRARAEHRRRRRPAHPDPTGRRACR